MTTLRSVLKRLHAATGDDRFAAAISAWDEHRKRPGRPAKFSDGDRAGLFEWIEVLRSQGHTIEGACRLLSDNDDDAVALRRQYHRGRKAQPDDALSIRRDLRSKSL